MTSPDRCQYNRLVFISVGNRGTHSSPGDVCLDCESQTGREGGREDTCRAGGSESKSPSKCCDADPLKRLAPLPVNYSSGQMFSPFSFLGLLTHFSPAISLKYGE